MRILIVDDDYVSRTKLKKLLSEYGDCDVAPSGEIAIQLVEEADNAGFQYGLITMDINMPQISGHEALKKIMEIDSHIKILMLTIQKAFKEVVNSYKEGCSWYITKPVDAQKLEDALKEVGIEK